MQSALTLTLANTIIERCLAKASELELKPLAVMVLDHAGHQRAFQAQDGTSPLRPQIAYGKAFGAVGLGMGSRAIFERAKAQPYFVNAVNGAANGALIPVPGGVLIRDAMGKVLGAVGITGDTSDKDEAVAISGIESVGLFADPG